MVIVMIISILIFLIILGLSIFVINKGYAYKQTIDEKPTSLEVEDNKQAK